MGAHLRVRPLRENILELASSSSYMYIVHVHLGVLCCFALLFVCFFLPFFSSLIKTCACTCMYNVCVFVSWGQWKDILSACDFRKRQLGVGDVENISRTIVSPT